MLRDDNQPETTDEITVRRAYYNRGFADSRNGACNFYHFMDGHYKV